MWYYRYDYDYYSKYSNSEKSKYPDYYVMSCIHDCMCDHYLLQCVRNFDHHCRWLNNCVGLRNYPVFFVLVFTTMIHCIFIAAISLYLFIASITIEDPPDNMRQAMGELWSPQYTSRRSIETALEETFGSVASIEAFMVGEHMKQLKYVNESQHDGIIASTLLVLMS